MIWSRGATGILHDRRDRSVRSNALQSGNPVEVHVRADDGGEPSGPRGGDVHRVAAACVSPGHEIPRGSQDVR